MLPFRLPVVLAIIALSAIAAVLAWQDQESDMLAVAALIAAIANNVIEK